MNRKLVVIVAMLVVIISAPAAAIPINPFACPEDPLGCEFDTVLSGAAEAPPNASPALGSAHASILFRADGSHELWLFYDFGTLADPKLLGGATGAQLHVINGPGDTNTLDTRGPAVTPLPAFPGFGYLGEKGGFDNLPGLSLFAASTYNPEWITASGGIEAAELALITGLVSGQAYFEITSSAFPDGEIRGFFTRSEPPPPIPEPSSVILLGSGLALLAARRRRARHQPSVRHLN
jgi:CHRD domain/PEP-CTERM motif